MTAGVAQIGPVEASRRLDELRVIDVRGAHEFDGPLGRVPGSTLVPLPELEARAHELPTDRPLLLVCRSGNRSGKACALLEQLGVGPTVNLAGGMIAWNRAGLPVEHTEPASLRELLDLVVAYLGQVGPMSGDAADALIRHRIERLGSSFDAPTRAAVDGILDFVEESLSQTGGPSDLDLSLSAFRRSLAAL